MRKVKICEFKRLNRAEREIMGMQVPGLSQHAQVAFVSGLPNTVVSERLARKKFLKLFARSFSRRVHFWPLLARAV